MGHGTGYGPFFRRAMVEQRMGPQADWSVVDALMLKTLAAAEKVARYRHAQLSPVRPFEYRPRPWPKGGRGRAAQSAGAPVPARGCSRGICCLLCLQVCRINLGNQGRCRDAAGR
jgi:hypothetical protein